MMGKSPLYAINNDFSSINRVPQNHWPSEPAASEETWKSGMGTHMGMQKKLRPSQVWKSSHHHVHLYGPNRILGSAWCGDCPHERHQASQSSDKGMS